ncbi:hypothetical protein CULT_30117 [[Clostridium] ultunense Esp]|nr:hypothetical protein CULT_30117 [[Clostridium] ultunense Esp]
MVPSRLRAIHLLCHSGCDSTFPKWKEGRGPIPTAGGGGTSYGDRTETGHPGSTDRIATLSGICLHRTDPAIRRTSLILLGQSEKGIALLDPLKGSGDPTTKADAFLWLSIAKEKLGQANEAASLLEEGKKIDPQIEEKRAEMFKIVDAVKK